MARRLALRILLEVDRGGRVREGLAAAFAERDAPPRDRALARELVSGVVRHQGSLDAVLGTLVDKPLERTHKTALAALRLGAYQLLHLDGIPDRAAVHATIEAQKALGAARRTGFVNAVLRRVAGLVESRGEAGAPRRSLARGDGSWVVLAADVLPDPAEDLAAHLAGAWSHPRWMVERWLARHGRDDTLRILAAGLARPPLSLHPADAHRAELMEALGERGIEFEEQGRCLLLGGVGRVEELPGFADGWFAVQDATAAEVVPAMDVRLGQGVLELCAAPGGKTLDIAERIGPEGALLAVDSSEARLGRLRGELERRGLSQVGALVADATDPECLPSGLRGRPTPGFDRVLVDVPCSNTGVLGRRVEARWRVPSADRVIMSAEQGEHLLMVAASRVAVGGSVTYSTCSLEPEENEDTVRRFLAEDPEFRLSHERATLPLAGRHDGGYFAVLTRKG